MAVKNRLKQLMDSKGVNRYRLWKDSGLAQNTAYRLYDDEDYIPGGDVMDAVCRTLKVQPGEWLEWVEDDRL